MDFREINDSSRQNWWNLGGQLGQLEGGLTVAGGKRQHDGFTARKAVMARKGGDGAEGGGKK